MVLAGGERAFDRVCRLLAEAGCQMKGSGRQMQAQCPAHEDSRPSLSVTDGNSRVLVRCHAGCDIDDVLSALGLNRSDLFDGDQDREQDRGGAETAVYDYFDEIGRLLFQVVRMEGKRFLQRVPDQSAKGGYRWRIGETRRVLYRLPDVLAAADAGRGVWVAEGEKDVHALESAGVTATCNPGGAGKWRPEYSQALAGAAVTIVADRDKPGQAHARMVARSLDGVAASVRIVEAAAGKDAADHLAASLGLDDFLVTAGDAAAAVDLAEDIHEFLNRVLDVPEWVIPGVMERGERMILTGPEGRGKSLLSRQLAVCAAAGVHPFMGREFIERRKVLFIDCENPERVSQKQFRRLTGVVAAMPDEQGESRRVPEGNLRVIHRPEGLDLSREDDAWLLERVTAHQPDLLVIGPLYRLHVIDANEETAARAIVNAIDNARLASGCAVVIEAHAPHLESGRSKRALRPAGSSLFLRWPEMGYGIRPLGNEAEWDADHVASFEQWRGPRDVRDQIPRKIMWGDPDLLEFPWVRHEEGNMING